MLVVGVLLLVVIDVVILTTYTIAGTLNGSFSSELVQNRENPEDRAGVSIV